MGSSLVSVSACRMVDPRSSNLANRGEMRQIYPNLSREAVMKIATLIYHFAHNL
jgi:hypothetical protein